MAAKRKAVEAALLRAAEDEDLALIKTLTAERQKEEHERQLCEREREAAVPVHGPVCAGARSNGFSR